VNELLEVTNELEPWLEKAASVLDRDFGGALADQLDKAFM
jgi:hypothetical protein